jgi:hypothetical protein
MIRKSRFIMVEREEQSEAEELLVGGGGQGPLAILRGKAGTMQQKVPEISTDIFFVFPRWMAGIPWNNSHWQTLGGLLFDM